MVLLSVVSVSLTFISLQHYDGMTLIVFHLLKLWTENHFRNLFDEHFSASHSWPNTCFCDTFLAFYFSVQNRVSIELLFNSSTRLQFSRIDSSAITKGKRICGDIHTSAQLDNFEFVTSFTQLTTIDSIDDTANKSAIVTVGPAI